MEAACFPLNLAQFTVGPRNLRIWLLSVRK